MGPMSQTQLIWLSELKQEGLAVWSIEQAEQAIFLNDFQPEPKQNPCLCSGK